MRQASCAGTENTTALAIVRLLLLSGFRISEGQGLKRVWLSASGGYVAFPDTKGDAQIRAIGPRAIELFGEQAVLVASPQLFPATQSVAPLNAIGFGVRPSCVTSTQPPADNAIV
jgi:hypothetical protein